MASRSNENAGDTLHNIYRMVGNSAYGALLLQSTPMSGRHIHVEAKWEKKYLLPAIRCVLEI